MTVTPNEPRPTISIIVPLWKDDALVPPMLEAAQEAAGKVEWIVAVVEPGADLRRIAAEGRCLLIECPRPSRGAQLNAGAAAASGALLCFHHADSMMTPAHIRALEEVAERKDILGGAFHRRFDNRHAWMRRWEKSVHRLDRGYGPFFGDQSIFVRAEMFRRMGGYADIPLMEDLEFSRRLKKAGKVVLLQPPMWSSPRRFKRIGNWRSTALNILLIMLYYAGVSPEKLHRWYYAGRNSQNEME